VRPFRILTHDDVESRPLLTEILDEAGNPVSDHALVQTMPFLGSDNGFPRVALYQDTGGPIAGAVRFCLPEAYLC